MPPGRLHALFPVRYFPPRREKPNQGRRDSERSPSFASHPVRRYREVGFYNINWQAPRPLFWKVLS